MRSTPIDILRVRVRYEDGSLVVRTLFRDLTERNTTITRRVTSLHDYWFDTDPDRRGYEYVMQDAGIENLNRRRPGVDRYVPCDGLSWRADLENDLSILVIPRACFREGERRVVRTRFRIQQNGPGRTAAGDGSYWVDTMMDKVVTGYVRHSRVS